MPSVVAQLLD